MLVHRNNDMLTEGGEQIDMLTGSDGIDDLSQGNGLITSLLQQIPPFDPMHKMPEQNTAVQVEVWKFLCW